VAQVLFLAVVSSSFGATFQETFTSNPATRGWRSFGDHSLFVWSETEKALAVTWDSSTSNSFYHMPLGALLSKSDDFSFSFDLRLKDIRVGSTPGKSNEFEIAVGLINYQNATNTQFFRGAGQSTTHGVRNLVEFDYFPDAGFGDTLATTVVSTNNRIFPVHNFPLTLSDGDLFHITLTYTATNQLLRTSATKNASPFGLPPDNSLADLDLSGKPDFRVDSFAIISYSDEIQAGPPSFHGSVLAHGTLDNIEWNLPPPAVGELTLAFVSSTSQWQVQFISQTNWTYFMERTVTMENWTDAAPGKRGSGGSLTIEDTNSPANHVFYRVRAERP
jgi:hypothetical protein